MAYSRIDRKVWYSRTFNKLDLDGKFLWFYILSNPHGNSAGYYVLAPSYAAADLKWPVKRFTKSLKEVCEIQTSNGHRGLCAYDEECQVLWIRNYLEVHPILNRKHLAGLTKALDMVPVSPLLSTFVRYLKASSNTYHKTLGKTLGIRASNTSIHINTDTNIDRNIDTKENENENNNEYKYPKGYLPAQNSAGDAKKKAPIKPYPQCPHENLIQLYQETCCPPMPKVEKWDKSQRAQMVKRWRYVIDRIQEKMAIDDDDLISDDNKLIYISWWSDFFKHLTLSDWLMGRTKEKWTADLQWVIGGKGFTRILNGRYHTKQQHSKVKSWIERKTQQLEQEGDMPI
jgi:hypothetical protein